MGQRSQEPGKAEQGWWTAPPLPVSASFHSTVFDCIVLRGFDTAGRTVPRVKCSALQCG